MHGIDSSFLSYGLHHFWDSIYLLAKTNSDIESLKIQIESLSKANLEIANALKDSKSVITFCFGAVGVVITALITVFKFWYGNSLKEVKETINSQVKSEVARQIKTSVSGRISTLEEIIDREDIIGTVSVEYLIPPHAIKNDDFKLLEGRGFKVTRLNNEPETVTLTSDIFVLDLLNSKYPRERREELVREIGRKIAKKNSNKPIFVVYVKEHLEEVRNLSDAVYYLSANSKVTLVGAVVNAANTSNAFRGMQQS